MQTAHPAENDFQISPLSDRSATVSFGNVIDQSVNEKVLRLHELLQQSSFEGFIESVPAYASLAIFYDVPKIKVSAQSSAFFFVKSYLQQLIRKSNTSKKISPATIKIPVCYDPELGLDILQLAEAHQLSIKEIISLHTAIIYRVYMIGFMPGFAYMGSVSEALVTPRKDKPRLLVPAGSVGIAGSQTGIYPVDSPGGWQIIGKTPLRLFDPGNSHPCLLAAGDDVQFFSIDKNEFQRTNGN